MGRGGRRGAALCGAALCGAALALAGCAATESLVPSTGDIGSKFSNLLAFHTTTPGAAPAAAAVEAPLDCPTIEVQDGTSSYRTYAGTAQTNEDVRYQFSMGEVARDCTKSGKEILLKVGASGRVLLGPAGSPGSFTVPVRIAVRSEATGKAVASKLYDVPATIPAGANDAEFQVVSEPIAVPFVSAHADGDYTILVGFDAGNPKPDATAAAAGEGRKKGRRPRGRQAADAPAPNG